MGGSDEEGEGLVGEGSVRRAELIAVLSLAVDVGLGVPIETGLRNCLRAVRLAEHLGLDESTVGDVFHLALVGHSGCTGDVHLHADLVGDEHEFTRRAAPAVHGDATEMLGIVLGSVGAGQPPLRRLATLAAAVPRFKRAMTTTTRTHCEVAQLLAARLGLRPEVRAALGQFYERWDGKGLPAGTSGADLPIAVRVVHVAEDAGLWLAFGDPGVRVGDVLRPRAGRAFDPAVVDAFCAHEDELAGGGPGAAEGSSVASVWSAVMDAEPGPQADLVGPDVDVAFEALASFADLKSFSTVGHSQGVADLAERAGRGAGLGGEELTSLRRAALVHDLGRAAVSVHVWDKPAPLSVDEWERVRLHAYHGERVMARSPLLARLAEVAYRHHERLDGSGYHRGCRAPELSTAARLLAAADAYHAMGEDRPHRPAHSPERAAELLAQEAREGRLDPEAVAAVLEAAGRPRPRVERPCGLTDREVDVLRLVARGLATKQVARLLGISVKTADRHIQNGYAKIGVSTRAAAAVFAMQQGLLR